MAKSPAWQRAEGKNPKGGLNAKGRASAKAQGMNLKPPVKKAEAAKSPKSAGRRKSFCGRMCGMKAKNTSSKTARDPNSRINKSLRAWDAESGWAVVDSNGQVSNIIVCTNAVCGNDEFLNTAIQNGAIAPGSKIVRQTPTGGGYWGTYDNNTETFTIDRGCANCAPYSDMYKAGTIKNGIVETGTPATMQVSTGVSNHAWHAIDIGAKRRISDISGIVGRESEVYRLALHLTCNISNPTAEEIIELSNSQFGEAVRILLQHCGTVRKILSSAPMKTMAAAWFCETGDMYSIHQYRALVNVKFDDMSNQSKVFYQQVSTGRIHSSDRIDILCRAYLLFDNSRKDEKKLMIHNVSDFKISNDYIAFYARLWQAKYPQYKDLLTQNR